MTTLIDDGLLENCLDDAISIIDLDQSPVVDVDNINATIEDPGYILDETTDAYSPKEEFKSSYKKQSFTLPVTFFDISRNVRLLKKCRPISIKIVDCHIYPWYYKETKHNIDDVIFNIDDESNSEILEHDSSDLISLWYHESPIKEPACSTVQSNFPKISISSEQASVVLKLNEEFKSQAGRKDGTNIIIGDIEKQTKTKKCHENTTQITKMQSNDLPVTSKSAVKMKVDQNIMHKDLLVYKELAQTIVRNIDQNDVTLKTVNKSVCLQKSQTKESNVSLFDEDTKLINVEESRSDKRLGKKRKQNENIITSPILPCTIKSQKKNKLKENILRKSYKVNEILEKCMDSNKLCDKFICSTNKIIPHYHCSRKYQINHNKDCYLSSMGTNPIYCQDLNAKDPALHWQQNLNYNGISYGKCNSVPAHDSQATLTPLNSSGELSDSDFYKNTCYHSLLTTSQKTKQQANGNINSNIHRSIYNHPYGFPSSLSYENNCMRQVSNFPNELNMNNGINLRLVRRANAIKTSKDQHHLYSRHYLPRIEALGEKVNERCVQNTFTPTNNYVDCSTTETPFTGTIGNMRNIIQTNPLLSRLLNSNKSRGMQPASRQNNEVNHIPVTVRNPYPVLEQNYWQPPRSHPPPSYDYHILSKRFNHSNNFKYPNTDINLDLNSNSVDSNIIKDKTDSNLKHTRLDMNTSEFSLTKDYNNVGNVFFNPINITNLMPPKVDCGNAGSHVDLTNVTQFSITPYQTVDQTVFNHMNTNNNAQSATFSTIVSVPKDKKAPRKPVIDSKRQMLNDIKSDCFDATINMNKKKKHEFSEANIFNELARPLNIHESEIKRINTDSSKTNISSLKPTKDTIIANSQQNVLNLNGYLVPILPIPSFKRSLEILSQDCPSLNTVEDDILKMVKCIKTCDVGKQSRTKDEYTNITRKRKHYDNEKQYVNNKKISTQQYNYKQ